MAAPISGTSSSTISHNKSVRGEENPGKGSAQSAAQEGVAPAARDAVSVSAAAEVLANAPTERGEGVIKSSEQASAIAQGLKNLFAGSAGQALAAQAKEITPEMMGVLKAG